MNNSAIAIIVEGGDYEPRIIHNIKSNFFNKRLMNSHVEPIILPIEMNIYMLWQKMRNSDYDIDIMEVIRESTPLLKKQLENYHRDDFSEVYLFFDYDKHQNNLPKDSSPHIVLKEMLTFFDNETENGKLYISYPMSEAIRDYVPGSCFAATGKCYLSATTKDYKTQTTGDNIVVDVNKYTLNSWRSIISCYINRIKCLFNNNEESIQFAKQLTPLEIYLQQTEIGNHAPQIIVLSAFPEFIIDYFKEDTLSIVVPLTETSMCEEHYNS